LTRTTFTFTSGFFIAVVTMPVHILPMAAMTALPTGPEGGTPRVGGMICCLARGCLLDCDFSTKSGRLERRGLPPS
jgi:hypothetical protein